MKLLYLSLTFGLAACSQTPTQVVEKPILVYPDLAPLPQVSPPQVYPVQFLLPKDASGNVENVDSCIQNSTSASTSCTSGNTNVFVGLDQTNYVHLLLNLQALHNMSTECIIRINQVNAERADWHAKDIANTSSTTTPAKAQ